MRITRHGTQDTVQGMFIILGHWHRLLHVRALLAKRNRGDKKFVQYTMDLLCIPDYFSKKGRPTRAPLREEARGQRILRRPFTQEEVQQEELFGHPVDSSETKSSART